MPTKAALAFYIGGMGARSRNFHMELMSRMGFEAEARKIQDLFFAGRRDEAIPLVPTQRAARGVARQPGDDDHRQRRRRHAPDNGRAGPLSVT